MGSLNSDRAALLEIDFQPWIIELGHDPDAVIRARAIRDKRRREGALIVCTRYLSLDAHDVMRSNPDSDGARFHPLMSPQADDLVVTKFDRDIFSNPDCDSQLRSAGVTDVLVMGFVTDYGVDLAARSALRLGYRVSVHADGCAGTTIEEHRAALDAMADAGIEIVE